MRNSNVKLRDAMYGIEFFDPERHSGIPRGAVHLLRHRRIPPSYLLHLTLEEFGGTNLGRGDKAFWKADLVFRGGLWRLRDWKYASWDLDGPPNRQPELETLLKKLSAAACALGHRLEREADRKIRADDFALANQFLRLFSYYKYLPADAERLLALSMNDEPLRELESVTTPSGSRITAFEDTAFQRLLGRLAQSGCRRCGCRDPLLRSDGDLVRCVLRTR